MHLPVRVESRCAAWDGRADGCVRAWTSWHTEYMGWRTLPLHASRAWVQDDVVRPLYPP